jgi:hypothetical protein
VFERVRPADGRPPIAGLAKSKSLEMLGLLGNQAGPGLRQSGKVSVHPSTPKNLSTFFIHSIHFSSSVKPFFH